MSSLLPKNLQSILVNNMTTASSIITPLISTSNLISNSATIPSITMTGSLFATHTNNTIANIFTTNGNVGINTTSPGSRLEVNGTMKTGDITVGNINFTGSLFQNGSVYLQWTPTSGNALTYTSGNIIASNGFTSTFNSNTIGNIFTTGGNVGIGTTSPNNRLDISGTARITTSLTTGSLFSTNQTTTNIVGTAISTGTLSSTTIATTLLTSTTISSSSLLSTNQTTTNIVGTTISTGTLFSTAINSTSITTGTLLATTSISSSSIQGTNSTITNAVHTALSTGTLNSTTVATSILTATSVFNTNQTTTNIVATNISGTNIIGTTITLTNGSLNATFNSNTIGNIFTTGGNVGIGITPNSKLHIYGTATTYGHLLIDDTNATIYGANSSGGGSAATLTLKAGYSAPGETDSQRSKFQINAWSSDSNIVNSFVFRTSGDTERMRIINSGNVGIGTSTPSVTLDVNGSIRASSGMLLSGSNVFEFGHGVSGKNVDAGKIGYNTWASGLNIVGAGTTSSRLVYLYDHLRVETSSTIPTLNITSTANITGTASIQATTNNYSLTSGALNVTGDIVLSGTELMFTTTGVGAPTMNGRGSGSKMILYPSTGTGSGDYSIGIEAGHMWFQVPTSSQGYKFYQGTVANMTMITNGNVGIGTATPLTTLDVRGNICMPLASRFTMVPTDNFSYSGNLVGHYALGWYTDQTEAGGAMSYISGYGGLRVFSNGTPQLNLTRLGNFGIGTTSPSELLTVNGSIRLGPTSDSNTDYYIKCSGQLTISANDAATQDAIYTSLSLTSGVSTNQSLITIVGSSTLKYIALNTSNTERMRIDASGNVGINTSAPTVALDVRSGAGYFGNFTGSVTTGFQTFATGGKLSVSSGVNGLPATTGSTPNAVAFRVRGGDNATLDFGANSINTWLQATDFTSGYNNNYHIHLNPNGGNVAIGNGGTTPTYKFQVNGNSGFTGNLYVNYAGAGSTPQINVSPNTNAAESSIGFWQNTNNAGAGWIIGHNPGSAGSDKFAIYNSTFAANTLTIQNDGNVGINNNSPGSRLHVYHNRDSEAGILCENPNSGTSAYAALRLKTNVANNSYIFMNSTGKTNDGPALCLTMRNDAGDLRLQSSGANGIYISSTSGNVGIGTTPSAKLHVFEASGTVASANSGSIILDHDNSGGASSITFRSKVNRGSDFAYIQYLDAATAGGAGEASKFIIGVQNDADDHIILDPGVGSVGIGTYSPGFKLHVSGNMRADDIYNSGWFRNYGDTGLYNQDYACHFVRNDAQYGNWRIFGNAVNNWSGLRFTTAEISLMAGEGATKTSGFHYNGTGWAMMIDASRNLYVPGDITGYWSDRRLKTNLQQLEHFDTVLCSLTGYSFNWNEKGQEILQKTPEEIEIGLIAQDVQAVIPQAVKVNKSGQKIDEPDPFEYLTINYDKIIPFLIEGYKAQKGEINELKSKIQHLEDLIQQILNK